MTAQKMPNKVVVVTGMTDRGGAYLTELLLNKDDSIEEYEACNPGGSKGFSVTEMIKAFEPGRRLSCST